MISSVFAKLNKIAPCTAFWGVHALCVPGDALAPLSSGLWNNRQLTIHAELDAAQRSTTEAQNPLELRGGDMPREFSITVEPNKVAGGLEPLTAYKGWCSALGKSNYFFLGVLPICTSMFILKEVNMSMTNRDFQANGAPWHAVIELSFVEDTQLKSIGKVQRDSADAVDMETGGNIGLKPAAKNALKG